ncbi:STAS domain-containing protein [Alkalihalobacterium chitinilyticum]|uniref:Anti-sigma factor antagonist n=1 Tax=Alkalihalobacterium chitinilyticum TaxID=2980103 RepID=A0ABT5VLA3_9BACI|nr:STAS domain-containing protein [Alkalihalobacterium chitinilyticum]MDE5415542.1 STAS domain-containing protein [Alkalihalobacterium chitinilyticum]
MGNFNRMIINRVEILKCDGEITLKNGDTFKTYIYELIEANTNQLLLDLSDVPYLNSAAIGYIADAVLKARSKNKELIVAGLQPNIQEIFEITKLGTFVKLFNDVGEALLSFKEV